jgi:DNA-binding response OmpR family regulator
MRVLVVDDEQPIVDAVTYNLRKDGYETYSAGDAEHGMELFRTEKPDLVILDVMLPSASGLDVCRMLRKQSNVPIIMLTARAEETDRVVGLELGADDYVTKPFSMRELVARVNTVLRRTAAPPAAPGTGRIEVADIVIDSNRYECRVRDRLVELSPREFELLRFLATHPGQAFDRQTLLDRVWGPDAYVVDRTVDVHIRWLREKVEKNPSHPTHILTVRGVGYKFVI